MKKLFLMIIVICSFGWYIPEVSASDIIWYTHHYVDEFGEPMQRRFATTHPIISGTFSNSATQDSKLNVRFLIDKEGLAIQLYEYAGNNPVKAYSTEHYNVFIRSKEGQSGPIRAFNYSDRLIFGKYDKVKVHKILTKGGIIDFHIRHRDSPMIQGIYKFTIQSVQPKEIGSYAKAYKDLGN